MGYRILLIDHGSGAAMRLGEALARAGHDMLAVAGVVEALVAVESRPLDAVLIDEGGAEEALTALCTRLARVGREKRSAVIVLADHVSRVVGDPFERARRLGCDRIVDSAISGDELLALLGALIGPPPPAPLEATRGEGIEDTNRDALSAESFRVGFEAPLLMEGSPALVAADDRGVDIEAHLDSLFAGKQTAGAPPSRPAAPPREAASVSTEPRLRRVAHPQPAAAPRVVAPPRHAQPATAAATPAAPPAARPAEPPAAARETVRRPPKALEQLRQPRVATPPAPAPVRRWPTVPPRAAVAAIVVLVAAGGIAGFAWLRPQRAAEPPPHGTAEPATARMLPPPAAPAPTAPPTSPSPATVPTDQAQLPAPPTIEEQPSTIDFAAPAIPVAPAAAPPPSPKPKPPSAAKPPVQPTPAPKPASAPVLTAAPSPPPAPNPAPAPAQDADTTTRIASVAPAGTDPAPAVPVPAASTPPEPGPAAVAPADPSPAPPPTPASEPATVPPAVIERVEPAYSAAALKKVDGSAVIVLRILVDEQGRIARVVVDRGLPGSELESAAISAVLRWSFRPATEDGTPVAAWTSARFEFKR